MERKGYGSWSPCKVTDHQTQSSPNIIIGIIIADEYESRQMFLWFLLLGSPSDIITNIIILKQAGHHQEWLRNTHQNNTIFQPHSTDYSR